MLFFGASLDASTVRRFSRQFGDTSNDALVRVAVITAREAAVLTQVKGKSKKKQIDAIITGAKVNVVGVEARKFNEIVRKRRPSIKIGERWVNLRASQILRSPDEINEFIERSRGKDGRTKKKPAEEKGVAKKADLGRVIVQRKKRAGEAKGSWLGAGQNASRFQRGASPERIGRNFIAWAQKHAGQGQARMKRALLGRSEVRLISKAEHTAKSAIFSKSDASRALAAAWRKAAVWYRREVKRRDK